MSEKSDLMLVDPTNTDLTEDDLHRAALTVCGYATDMEEARMLLDMLGLLEVA